MNPELTFVSIILPNYNGVKYLGEAVKSLLNQTHTNFELIIVDDGSTDGSPEFLKNLAESDDRIVLDILPTNKGIVNALNRAVDLSKGELLIRMDSDDICRSNRIERLVELSEEHPNCGVIGSAMQRFGQINSVSAPSSNDSLLKAHLLFGTPLNHPTVLIRKSILLKNNIKYDSNYPHMEDYYLFYKLCKVTDFFSTQEILYDYRNHDDNITKQKADSLEVRMKKLHAEIFNDLGYQLSEEELSIHYSIVNLSEHYSGLRSTLKWCHFIQNIGNKEWLHSDSVNIVLNQYLERYLYKLADSKPFQGIILSVTLGGFRFKYFNYCLKSIVSR